MIQEIAIELYSINYVTRAMIEEAIQHINERVPDIRVYYGFG